MNGDAGGGGEARRRQAAMGRKKPATASPAAQAAFAAPPPAYAKRLTLDLTAEDHRSLKLAALDADAAMTDLLRGFVALLRERPALAAEAAERGRPA